MDYSGFGLNLPTGIMVIMFLFLWAWLRLVTRALRRIEESTMEDPVGEIETPRAKPIPREQQL